MRISFPFNHGGIGNNLGYTAHTKNLRLALTKQGVEIDEDADIRVSITPPYFFKHAVGKYDVLYTMFEFTPAPDEWKYSFANASLIMVPCEMNREMFQAVTSVPVETCKEGINPDFFYYRERKFKRPFVFLYVGDHNPRKGVWHITEAWAEWNKRYPNLAKDTQIIYKMTCEGVKKKQRRVTNNAYIDYRVLPLNREDSNKTKMPTLGDLYEYANCFLFPTCGEGFGLTLAEAAATGLPCIYTPWSGPVDFMLENYAYPIKYGRKEFNLVKKKLDGDYKTELGKEDYGGAYAADPDIDHIVERMKEVYLNYDAALEKAKVQSEHIHKHFTWDKSAKRFIEIIKNHAGHLL